MGVDEENFIQKVEQRWKSPNPGGDYNYLKCGFEVGFAELLQEIGRDPCWEREAGRNR